MRRFRMHLRLVSVAIALAVTLAVAVSLAPTGNTATAQDGVTVQIVDFTFSPSQITVEAGRTVTWVNNDSVAHTATGDGGEFDTGSIGPGESASITFNNPGTFAYHCSFHPEMTANLVVTAAAGDDNGAAAEAVTQLPDTGAGVTVSDGIGASNVATLAALVSVILTAVGLALRRRAA